MNDTNKHELFNPKTAEDRYVSKYFKRLLIQKFGQQPWEFETHQRYHQIISDKWNTKRTIYDTYKKLNDEFDLGSFESNWKLALEEEESTKEYFKKKFENLYSLKTLLEKGIPKIEWLVENIIPKRGITFFGGTSGSMKSFAAMQLAVACGTGTKFLNHYDTEPCSVLYIDEENGNVTIPFRFDKLVKGHEVTSHDLSSITISIFNNITLDTKEGIDFLRGMINEYNPKLIIIDSMVRCMEGEEDKASDVKSIFSNLKEFLDEDISFLILHHTVKNNINSMAGLRGSGDFSAFADVVAMFQAGKEGYCNVNVVKNRHVAIDDLSEFYFAIEPDQDENFILQWKGLSDERGNVIERCADDILMWLQDEDRRNFTTSKGMLFADEKGYTKSTFYSSIKHLVDNGKIDKLRRGIYSLSLSEFPVVDSEKV